MNKLRNQMRGLRAKKVGDAWESLLELSARMAGCRFIKIPSGCRWINATRALAVKSPFDYVFIKNGVSVFLDAKSSLGSSFSFSSVDQHQVSSLMECARGGARAGYIVEYRFLNQVVFYNVVRLAGLEPRQSLKPSDGVQLSSDGGRLNLGVLFNEQRQEISTTGSPTLGK